MRSFSGEDGHWEKGKLLRSIAQRLGTALPVTPDLSVPGEQLFDCLEDLSQTLELAVHYCSRHLQRARILRERGFGIVSDFDEIRGSFGAMLAVKWPRLRAFAHHCLLEGEAMADCSVGFNPPKRFRGPREGSDGNPPQSRLIRRYGNTMEMDTLSLRTPVIAAAWLDGNPVASITHDVQRITRRVVAMIRNLRIIDRRGVKRSAWNAAQ